jgi:ABC-2 type transport system ATP-binding protein
MMHGLRAVEPPAVTIESVSHLYGARQALNDVSCSIAPSTFAFLLGLNGAGKSTLFSLIMRLYAIQRGRIRVFGHDVGPASGEALRMVGVVFQQRTLDLDLSVDDVLARIALSDRAQYKVRILSGRQMRRVEIARALLHRPRLLVLDEPMVGLDIKSSADILGHVRRLIDDEGVSVLWATHLIDEVSDDDDVIVLHQGRVLGHGSVARLLEAEDAQDLRAAFTRLTQEVPSQSAREAS